MAAKKKAAKAGAGAVAAAEAVRSNEYVQRLVEDDELRDNLRTAYESAKKAYSRINGKGPMKALTEDKKTQKELKEAASSLRDAADALRNGKKKKKRRFGRVLLLAIVGGGLALALSEDLRKKVLDALFGAEEEFEYTSSTTPNSASSTSAGAPVGST
jgi:adenylosuccinate synthase